MDSMYAFLAGSIAIECWVAALFFARFWKKTGDRFFFIFCTAFVILGFERLVFALMRWPNEHSPWVYLLRVLAFILILIAIADKNRARA